jgi:hypothetical protein
MPGEVQHFTGRVSALAELRRRVAEHGPTGAVVAISAVTGMAGVGKTTLAVHAAHAFAEVFGDGWFFIDLYGFTAGVAPVTAEDALEELLRQAGVPVQAIPSTLAERQAAWRRVMAGRRAVVVLDNARDSSQVRPLLPMAAGCLVLIASRSRLLALTEASPLPLDVLTLPEAAQLFMAVAGETRCPDRADVDRVVLACGRLPLAVRIAAGRLCTDQAATVAAVAAELEDERARLDELSPEQAGVRAAFAASVERLDPARRGAFWIVGGASRADPRTVSVCCAG